jgi:predicted homoserine dehydrogenase-like protein
MKKVVLVGFGFMGLTHTVNILKNKRLHLVAIVDKNIGNVEKNLGDPSGNLATGSISRELLQGIKLYSDLDECLLLENTDAVFICVHTDLHVELAEKALNAGKHVFLEKPICLDIRQGEALVKLAAAKGTITELDIDNSEILARLVEQKAERLDLKDIKQKNRLIGFLIRRGYKYDEIFSAIREYCDNKGEI